jgi:hypothetical protein
LLKLGDIVGNDYPVLEGLKPGDHVILSGLQFLQDGAPVAETKAENKASSDSKAAAGPKSR